MLKLLVLYRYLKEKLCYSWRVLLNTSLFSWFQGAPGHFGIKGVQGDRGLMVGEVTN